MRPKIIYMYAFSVNFILWILYVFLYVHCMNNAAMQNELHKVALVSYAFKIRC